MTEQRKAFKTTMIIGLQGTGVAKARLRAILETLAGTTTVTDACLHLGIAKRRFYAARRGFLQTGLLSLEPRPMGRPRHGSGQDPRIAELQTALHDLRIELRAAQIREEIALSMPHLLLRSKRSKKVTRRAAKRRTNRSVSSGC